MIRRRGDTPPDHPLDVHDTGRDHITSPQMKNDGPHEHPTKNTVRTAAAPTSTIERTAP